MREQDKRAPQKYWRTDLNAKEDLGKADKADQLEAATGWKSNPWTEDEEEKHVAVAGSALLTGRSYNDG